MTGRLGPPAIISNVRFAVVGSGTGGSPGVGSRSRPPGATDARRTLARRSPLLPEPERRFGSAHPRLPFDSRRTGPAALAVPRQALVGSIAEEANRGRTRAEATKHPGLSESTTSPRIPRSPEHCLGAPSDQTRERKIMDPGAGGPATLSGRSRRWRLRRAATLCNHSAREVHRHAPCLDLAVSSRTRITSSGPRGTRFLRPRRGARARAPRGETAATGKARARGTCRSADLPSSASVLASIRGCSPSWFSSRSGAAAVTSAIRRFPGPGSSCPRAIRRFAIGGRGDGRLRADILRARARPEGSEREHRPCGRAKSTPPAAGHGSCFVSQST